MTEKNYLSKSVKQVKDRIELLSTVKLYSTMCHALYFVWKFLFATEKATLYEQIYAEKNQFDCG